MIPGILYSACGAGGLATNGTNYHELPLFIFAFIAIIKSIQKANFRQSLRLLIGTFLKTNK
jgi:hypothetical protein